MIWLTGSDLNLLKIASESNFYLLFGETNDRVGSLVECFMCKAYTPFYGISTHAFISTQHILYGLFTL